MAKYRMINTRFWNDSFVADHCNALDRLLFLYLLTNERTNILGVYEAPIRTIAYETGIDKDDVEKMLKRLEPKIYYFEGWVFIHKFIEHQQRNAKVIRGMMNEFQQLPEKIKKWVDSTGVENDTLSKAIDRLSIEYDKYKSESKSESQFKSKSEAKDHTSQKLGGFDKKAYAKAVKADEALAKKESEARNRDTKGSGYESAKAIADKLKRKDSK